MLSIIPPKDLRTNLHWRTFVRRRANASKRDRDRILERCKYDHDFFIDSFGWQYNPANVEREVGPFILRQKQSEILNVITNRLFMANSAKLRLDTILRKSREEGASWMALLKFVHRALFWNRQKFLCVSHTADAVDKSGDPDSLFWKIDHIHEHLPEWMEPPRNENRIKMRFWYPKTKSAITGAASSGRSGVGGRATAVLLDELAKQKDAFEIIAQTADTGPRLMISTFYGTGDAFYAQCQRPDVHIETLHWTDNPEKNPGMYKWVEEENRIEIIDKNYDFPPDYQFVRAPLPSGGPFRHIRSVWYDAECIRRQSPRDVAMHLDIDPEGAGHQFFDGPTINKLVLSCVEPCWRGDIVVDPDDGTPIRLEKSPEGPLKLWVEPKRLSTPFPIGRYSMASDVAAGTLATPSTIAVGDADLGQKILEYQNNSISPELFAVVCAGVGRMFLDAHGREALFAFENAGAVGAAFAKRFFELGYTNVYYQDAPMEFAGMRKKTSKPGWYPRRDAVKSLLSAYRLALNNRTFYNPSKKALEDCTRFVYITGGDVKHSGETATDDPSAVGENHGDQVIADALCCMLLEILGMMPKVPEQPREPKLGSFARRFRDGNAFDRERELEWV